MLTFSELPWKPDSLGTILLTQDTLEDTLEVKNEFTIIHGWCCSVE